MTGPSRGILFLPISRNNLTLRQSKNCCKLFSSHPLLIDCYAPLITVCVSGALEMPNVFVFDWARCIYSHHLSGHYYNNPRHSNYFYCTFRSHMGNTPPPLPQRLCYVIFERIEQSTRILSNQSKNVSHIGSYCLQCGTGCREQWWR